MVSIKAFLKNICIIIKRWLSIRHGYNLLELFSVHKEQNIDIPITSIFPYLSIISKNLLYLEIAMK